MGGYGTPFGRARATEASYSSRRVPLVALTRSTQPPRNHTSLATLGARSSWDASWRPSSRRTRWARISAVTLVCRLLRPAPDASVARGDGHHVVLAEDGCRGLAAGPRAERGQDLGPIGG